MFITAVCPGVSPLFPNNTLIGEAEVPKTKLFFIPRNECQTELC